jgi:hypothetical protein
MRLDSLHHPKTNLKSKTHIVITCGLIFVILFVSFCVNLFRSYANLSSTMKRVAPKLELLLLNNPESLISEINTETTQVLKDLSPVIKFTGLNLILQSDVEKASLLGKEWVRALTPLTKYKLNSDGFVSTQNSNNRFTLELAIFFDSAEELVNQTQKLYDKLNLYTWFVELIRGDKLESLKNLQDFLDLTKELISNKNNVLTILGHYSSQKYVIFTQNTGEARPSGGFLGSYTPLEILQGRFLLGSSQSIYYVSNGSSKQSFSHPSIWNSGYLSTAFGIHGLHNDNTFSCFDTSAQLLEKNFVNSENGYGMNGLIMLTSSVIKKLLPSGFKLKIDDDLVLGYDNILDEIERITSLEAEDKTNPKYRIGEIFTKILENFDTIFKDVSLRELASRILTAVVSKDIQIWFKDKAIQNYWSTTFLAPNKNCLYNSSERANVISPLITNLSGDKRNLITQNQFNIFAEKRPGFIDVHLKYKQILPKTINLQRGFQKFSSLTFVGLQIPKNSSNFNVESPQGLSLKFPSAFYKEYISLDYQPELVLQSEVRGVVETARNIPNSQGVSYVQPDNSQVVGIYIADDNLESRVNFSFSVPDDGKYIEFFGQPGLNQPLISLGKNLEFADLEQKYTSNDSKISAGMKILVNSN